MRRPIPIALLFAAVLLVGCSEKAVEVEIDETREITSEDKSVKLFATSYQRFRPGERRYAYDVPEGWLSRPQTQFRKLNFLAGEEGRCEIYLSESQGDLGDNVNRWRRQFGQEPATPEEVGALPRVLALGAELALVEAQGTYSPGMGKAPSPEFALAGVIGSTRDGVITVKMVGPQTVVQAERDKFLAFCRSLTIED